MSTPSSSPLKSLHQRGAAHHYKSSLIFEKQGQDQLASLSVASCNPAGLGKQSGFDVDSDAPFEAKKAHTVPVVMSCNCCQVTFDGREEQINHFKSDWHRYNLHLKLRGYATVTEEEFDKVADASDVSSISGSDSSDEDEEIDENSRMPSAAIEDTQVDPSGLQNVSSERKFHKVFFKNHAGQLISLHRCLLHHKKNPITDGDEMVKAAMELPNKAKWTVFMISSGHFAGAVFNGKEVVAHKTFHRYTVRQKCGTAQSTRDNKGNAPKSAGSHLRRYNETALNQEVTELMNSWNDHLSSSDFIFVRIPVNNRGIFYGGKHPILKKDDPRIRIIPFPTRRPTFNEIRRVQQVLASVESYGQEEDIGDMIPYSPPRVFVPETGELQLREPRPEKKAKVSSPKKLEKISNGMQENADSRVESLEQTENNVEPIEENDMDVQLVEMSQTIDFSHLKEFERTPNPKKKNKKKKKDSAVKPNTTPEGDAMDDDRIRWQNKLFTACKTGDIEALQKVIGEIKNTSIALSSKSIVPDAPAEFLHRTDNSIIPELSDGIDSLSLTNSPVLTKQDLSISGQLEETYNVATAEPKGASEIGEPQQPRPPSGATISVSELLVQVLNKPIGDSGSTLLHLSAKHGQADVVTALMEEGADPANKDKSGKTPYGVGEIEVRNTMRRFMAIYPDRYDYQKAQVPSPLTAEMEAERKQKNAERRKQKKKAFNEKNKEKKAIEAKVREEKEEENRFLKLSDREKRALAAERRLVQQQTEQGGAKPVLSRCWQCGKDITGQVPFEYSDYKFCSTKCLREHRAAKTSS